MPVSEPDGENAAGDGADQQPGHADEGGEIAATALEAAYPGDIGDHRTGEEAAPCLCTSFGCRRLKFGYDGGFAKRCVVGKANRLPLWLGIRRGID